jgi:hypothetical protein
MSAVAHPVYPLLGPSLVTIAYKKNHGDLPFIVGTYMLSGGYTPRVTTAPALNVAQTLSYNPPPPNNRFPVIWSEAWLNIVVEVHQL